jgi:apolipoprotein N-acyltransferase
VRSTATGISAFVDASGRLVQKSEFEQAQTLIQDVPMIEGGATIYARIGDLLGWLALAICGVAALKRGGARRVPGD